MDELVELLARAVNELTNALLKVYDPAQEIPDRERQAWGHALEAHGLVGEYRELRSRGG